VQEESLTTYGLDLVAPRFQIPGLSDLSPAIPRPIFKFLFYIDPGSLLGRGDLKRRFPFAAASLVNRAFLSTWSPGWLVASSCKLYRCRLSLRWRLLHSSLNDKVRPFLQLDSACRILGGFMCFLMVSALSNIQGDAIFFRWQQQNPLSSLDSSFAVWWAAPRLIAPTSTFDR